MYVFLVEPRVLNIRWIRVINVLTHCFQVFLHCKTLFIEVRNECALDVIAISIVCVEVSEHTDMTQLKFNYKSPS